MSEKQSGDAEISSKKFGTFKGVFVPSILTILGVILFLRLGWVVGSVGFAKSAIIIVLSSMITFITGLAISATATNMKVGIGGSYFLISRCFGVEAGAAIGLPLFLAQAFGISFYVMGFAESLQYVFPDLSQPLVGASALVILAFIAFFSSDLALRTQILIFAIIIVAILSFLFGAPAEGPHPTGALKSDSFWVVFAVFFPAVTGIEAGIAMSGDLKDPSKSLPLGTMLAVVVGLIIYIGCAYALSVFAEQPTLLTNRFIMKDVALFGPAVYLGLWGATLSSTMGALMGAPRTIQALARDRVLPSFLGKGHGELNEPRIALAFSFFVALGGIFLGGLDTIAPILSMFFLTSYGALNLIAALEALIGSPSWRPAINTPWYVSFIGALLCFAVMMLINPGASLIAFVLITAIYFLMKKRRMQARFSDIKRGLLQLIGRFSIYQLSKIKKEPRTWTPNVLVLSGTPTSRFHLIDFARSLTHGNGILTVGSVLTTDQIKTEKLPQFEKSVERYLSRRNIEALVKIHQSEDFFEGATAILRNYGMGAFTPNTLIVGSSREDSRKSEFSFFIENCHKSNRNLVILDTANLKTGDAKADEEVEKELFQTIRHIDVWWNRDLDEFAFQLILANQLSTHPLLEDATLHIKALVENEEAREHLEKTLHTLLESSRLDCEVQTFVRSEGIHDLNLIAKYSKDTDLVFFSLKKPDTSEDSTDAVYDYETALKATEKLPMTAMCLRGEKIEFSKILNQ